MKHDLSFSADYGSRIYGAMRLVGLAGLIVALLPVQIGFYFLWPKESYRSSQVFYRLILCLFGFRVRVHGNVTDERPTLFVANHISYLDIPVLGALIPAVFVAKADVASWPVIGFLCKLHNTVFVERRSVRASDQREQLRGHLQKGQSLVLFPEGTSTEGLGVLPFKSSLFAMVEEAVAGVGITIQPVSITCTGIDGLPIPRAWRPYYAWYGDMTFVAHFWGALKCGRFTLDIVFHEPIASAGKDRKQLAAACHKAVAHGIEQCLSGRKMGTSADAARLPALT